MNLLARLGGRQRAAPPRVEYCRVLHAGRESAVMRDLRALRDAAACGDGAGAPAADEAEPGAVHFAAYADIAGDPASTQLLAGVRLVRPPAGQPFPFEQHASGTARPAQQAGAEVADLVLHPAWRGRPAVLLGLYRDMLRHSRAEGVAHWYAGMDAALARTLAQLGLPFMPLGPDLYVLELDALAPHLRRHDRLLAAWFEDAPLTWWMKRRLRARGVHLRR